MHELGFCEAILEAVERRAAGRRVSTFSVHVGVLHRVEKPALDQGFALVSEGTVAEGAKLELVVVPVRASCGSCGLTTTSEYPVTLCPSCGGDDLVLRGGDELVLESITVGPEVEDEGRLDVPGHTG